MTTIRDKTGAFQAHKINPVVADLKMDIGVEPDILEADLINAKEEAVRLFLRGDVPGCSRAIGRLGLRHRMAFQSQINDIVSLTTIVPLPGAKTMMFTLALDVVSGLVIRSGFDAQTARKWEPQGQETERIVYYVLPVEFDPLGKSVGELEIAGYKTGVPRM